MTSAESDDEENLDIDMNKHGIDPEGDYGQDDEEVDEGILDTAKKIGGKVLDKLGHGSDEDLLRDLQRRAGIPVQHGEPRMAMPNDEHEVEEDLDTDGVMMTKASNMSS
jgi:hypothetical protein